MPAEDVLKWLAAWYQLQCDGDWEHQHGVEVGTLDNPGWRLRVNLAGTELEGRYMERRVLDRSSDDWMQCWLEDDCFHAAGGPTNLGELLRAFQAWATSPDEV